MIFGLHKIAGSTVLAAAIIVCSLVFNASDVQAADQCCIYTINSTAPSWLVDLGGSSTFIKSADASGNCTDISATVPISLFTQYYDKSTVAKKCSDTTTGKNLKQDLASIQCCILKDVNGKALACADKSKTDTTNNCFSLFQQAGKLTSVAQQLYKSSDTCDKIDPCVALKGGAAAPTTPSGAPKSNDPLAGNGANGKKVWSKEECESVKQKKSSEPAFIWIPPKSDPSATSGDFCYIRQQSTNLQVSIGSSSVIKGLPEYINVVYKYAIGIGVIAMIITIMFSGIQWMMSGIASTINDAKARIQNGALGLLLLLGANTILYTINPQLLNLHLPPMHAVRPESFDVAAAPKDEGTRCDPGVEDSCSALGPTYKCKPTGYYVGNKCLKQANGFMAVALGGAAIAAAGPFALAAAETALLEQGAGQIVKKVAIDAAEDQLLNAATGGTVNGKQAAQEAAQNAAGELGGTKGKLLMQAVAVAGGLAIAADLYADAKEASEPANGYCVQPKHDLPDFSVCQFDDDCQSSKCLLTSSAACGAGKFGVCVSGKLRQSCVIPSGGWKKSTVNAALSLVTSAQLPESEAAKKYGCNEGKCVNNGRGASLDGVGVCSDGSDIGMACDDNVPCKQVNYKGTSYPLACIKGFCRDASMFSGSFGTTGLWYDFDGVASHPRCLMPTDCNDASINKFSSLQGTIMTGCLKGPSPSMNLPGRLLISQLNQPIGKGFYQELSTYGRCVTDKPYWNVHKDKTDGSSPVIQKLSFACFVNIYPTDGFDESTNNKKVADYLTSKNIGLVGPYAKGFVMQKVGCGCAKASYKGYGNDNCGSTQGACTIDLGAASGEQAKYTNNSFISVQGTCDDAKGTAKLDIFTVGGKEMLYVSDEDVWHNGIRFPNIIDVQYTFAGTAQGAGATP